MSSAQNIIKQNNMCEEVDLRNAVSRAYYSAYHVCLCRFEQAENKDVGSHERLIAGMRAAEDVQIQELAEELKNLKAKRTKADYKLDLMVTDNQTYQALSESAQICDKAEAIKPQFKVVS